MLLLLLFKIKVSDRDQDRLKLSEGDSSSVEIDEKAGNQRAKAKPEATNRFAAFSIILLKVHVL